MKRSFSVLTLAACMVARGHTQDRVILLDPCGQDYFAYQCAGGELQQFDVSQGGRVWELRLRVGLSGRWGSRPVVWPDGRQMFWLAYANGSSVVVQYDVAAARAGVVDVGTFHDARLVADTTRPVVYVVEPQRIVSIDDTYQTRTLTLAADKTNGDAYAIAGRLVVQRKPKLATETSEIVGIDLAAGSIEKTVSSSRSIFKAAAPIS